MDTFLVLVYLNLVLSVQPMARLVEKIISYLILFELLKMGTYTKYP